jgi:hypothetical protein
MMTRKEFEKMNRLLAGLIYASGTSEAMRTAAKDARRSLFQYQYGSQPPRNRLHRSQTAAGK